MQIVIDTRQCPCRTLSEECGISGYECYEDDICSTCPLIRNGGVELPKGHGRIGDLDRLYNVFERNVVSADAFKELFDHAPTIIEADKAESEVKCFIQEKEYMTH